MQQLVSIIVPAYNAERFIARTLRSALRQTYVTFEMIVIDDGSTDSTGAVARAFAQSDERVRVISVPNGGVAKARNIGMATRPANLSRFSTPMTSGTRQSLNVKWQRWMRRKMPPQSTPSREI